MVNSNDSSAGDPGRTVALLWDGSVRIPLRDLPLVLDQSVVVPRTDYDGACRTIALMHAAAVGLPGWGPRRGVVEDVEDLRERYLAVVRQLRGGDPGRGGDGGIRGPLEPCPQCGGEGVLLRADSGQVDGPHPEPSQESGPAGRGAEPVGGGASEDPAAVRTGHDATGCSESEHTPGALVTDLCILRAQVNAVEAAALESLEHRTATVSTGGPTTCGCGAVMDTSQWGRHQVDMAVRAAAVWVGGRPAPVWGAGEWAARELVPPLGQI